MIKKNTREQESEGKRTLESSRQIKIYNTEVGCEFVNWVHPKENRISDRISQHDNGSSDSIHGEKLNHNKSVL